MTKLNKRAKRVAFIVMLLILTATFLRVMSQYLPQNDIRGLIYIGLFTAWGISMRWRIIQVQTRRYLTAVSVLIVFWVVVRTVRFMFPTYVHLCRYCWYLYYLPMLFIPPLMLLVALSLGTAESFSLPKCVNLLFLVSSVLFLSVLTNDYHQLTFRFSKGLLFYENGDYSHGLLYSLSMVWVILCSAAAFVVMVYKCHVPGKKKRIWLPIVPMLAMIVYAVLYLTAWDAIKLIAGDMTVVCCLLITTALESCIHCRLIQSNTRYEELFRAADIRAKISDNDYHILISSTDSDPLPVETMRQTENDPVLVGEGIRLCGAPIRGGHVMWSENVSELTALLYELSEINEELEESNNLLQAEYRKEKRKLHLLEKNRLYNKMQMETADKIDLMQALLTELENADSAQREKLLIINLTILGTYIKRRNNLLFIAEEENTIPANELERTFEDSLACLSDAGIEANFEVSVLRAMPLGEVIFFFDRYEALLEQMFDKIDEILVAISGDDDKATMRLDVHSHGDLSGVDVPDTYLESLGDCAWRFSCHFLGEVGV